MLLKISHSLVLIFLANVLIAAPGKYPIYTLGIQFSKPSKYFLATTETESDLKKSLLKSERICASAKKSIELSFSKTNFKLFLNIENFNEQIYFYKTHRYKVDADISGSMKEYIKEQCLLVGGISAILVRDTTSICQYGEYTALLFKINTPEITYYSEGFFIEGSTGTLMVTINSINETSNFDIIQSIEHISTGKIEKLIIDIDELMSVKDYKIAQLKVDTCIRLDPLNVRGYEKRMVINLYYKKYSDVIKDAELILRIDGNYLNGLIIKGLAYYALDDYLSAIECFDLVQKKMSILSLANLQNDYHTSSSQLYRLKGEAFIKLKNVKMALENLENALRLSVDSFNTGGIYYSIGILKSSLMNDADEAISYYSLSINNYPADKAKEKSEAFFNRAINYRKRGNIIMLYLIIRVP